MDAVRLESYSKALAEFADDADTLVVLERLVKSRRAEYESKIPELGEMMELVREERRGRVRVAREAAESARFDALHRDRELHPDKYVSARDFFAEIVAELDAKREAAKVVDAVPVDEREPMVQPANDVRRVDLEYQPLTRESVQALLVARIGRAE